MQCAGVCQLLCIEKTRARIRQRGKSYVLDLTQVPGNACLSIASDFPSCFPTGVSQFLPNDGGASFRQSDRVDADISI